MHGLQAFMLSLVKMRLKGEVQSGALDSHGNYIVDHGKILNDWMILNFCRNPDLVFYVSSSQ